MTTGLQNYTIQHQKTPQNYKKIKAPTDYVSNRNGSARQDIADLVITPRIPLGKYAIPYFVLVFGGHEDPLGDFNHRATTTTTNIIEGGGANSYTRGIGTFRQYVGQEYIDRRPDWLLAAMIP